MTYPSNSFQTHPPFHPPLRFRILKNTYRTPPREFVFSFLYIILEMYLNFVSICSWKMKIKVMSKLASIYIYKPDSIDIWKISLFLKALRRRRFFRVFLKRSEGRVKKGVPGVKPLENFEIFSPSKGQKIDEGGVK